MSNYTSDIPLVNVPFVDENGCVAEAWLMLLIQLWRRTGGSNGSNPVTTDMFPSDILSSFSDTAQASAFSGNTDLAFALVAQEFPGAHETTSGVPSTQNALDEMVFAVPSVTTDKWTAATLQNSWVNYGPNYNPAGYWKDPFGIVHLRGIISSGTMSTTAFTLPPGYLPANREQFACVSNYSVGAVEILPTGTVFPFVGSNVYFSLDGITFRAAG